MKKQTEFKNTEIGRIPKDWDVVRLDELGELQYGYTASAIDKDTGKKLLRITDIGDYGQVVWKNVPHCEISQSNYKKYKLSIGDILFARIGATTGKSTYINKEINGVFASYLIRFKPLVPNLSTEFLYYCTQSNLYWNQVHRKKEGQLKKGLNAKILAGLIFPLPPLPEQQKIAEILSTVDEAIEKVDDSIEKTKRLKNGLMCELLTKGIGHKEFKDTEIGRIPKEWEVSSLSKIIKLASGKTRPSEIADMPSTTMPHPVYGGNGILGYTNTFIVDKETIVIGRVGEYCGSIHKTLGLAWITDNALYAVEIQRGSVELDYLIYSLAFINLNKFKKKSGQPLMTQKIIYSISIPLPPLPEQQKIAEILSTVDKRLELLRSKKEKLERIKKGLMNELLTGQRRVKILES